MSHIEVTFNFYTGLRKDLFARPRLKGSWDSQGRFSDTWSTRRMDVIQSFDECPAFSSAIQFDASQVGTKFRWGVEVDGPGGPDQWAMWMEEKDPDSRRSVNEFELQPVNGDRHESQDIFLTNSRRLGAQKYRRAPNGEPGIRFSVWAPNAKSMHVLFGDLRNANLSGRPSLINWQASPTLRSAEWQDIFGGYIADDAISGASGEIGTIKLHPGRGGIWESDPSDPRLSNFARFDHVPYMFLVETASSAFRVRTDLYARCQIGSGSFKPRGSYEKLVRDLDGTVSCSVVVDPDKVTSKFEEPVWPELNWTTQEEFFHAAPASPQISVPRRGADMVIYELHLAALLGPDSDPGLPGTLKDAMSFLDYLQDLGVNCLELLPLSEFGGGSGAWGYSTSHYFAIEYGGGGRDQFKWLIRECHRRGIAVMADVVYNHYAHDAERAEWMFDSDTHERNSYYWYEGLESRYPKAENGYVDNISTGWAPRYWEPMVRSMFVSSAITLAIEFEIDGFRVDQTTSIHSYNALHADGRQLANVNAYGCKLLRELTRALRFVKPEIVLHAEDHSHWSGVTESADAGGLGFDATWYADFYHHLIGDGERGPEYARLLQQAGYGDDRALAMDKFAHVLSLTNSRTVVYCESHDEAGNGRATARNINVAVNGAMLVDETRRFAEARCKAVAGLTFLSAGIPMFLFGEEVGLARPFLYDRVLEEREDLRELRDGKGRHLFAFYRDLIQFRLRRQVVRQGALQVMFVHNEHRLLVFRRVDASADLLVVASLNNRPFDDPGYGFSSGFLPDANWQEIFNSDAAAYGGKNVGNFGSAIASAGGYFHCVVPSNALLVFSRL
jgi:1,4-alpha-glucan branching enzyme